MLKKWRFFLITAALVLSISCFPAIGYCMTSYDWTFETAMSNFSDVDQSVSIAINSSNLPSIASYKKIGDPDPVCNESERMYRDLNGTWSLYNPPIIGCGNGILSLALIVNPVDDNPQLATVGTMGGLVVEDHDGSEWTISWGWSGIITDSAFSYNPLNNSPGVAFFQNGSLIYSEADGTYWGAPWHDETVDNITLGPALAYTSTGDPCIAYFYNNALKYAQKDSTWNITTVDTSEVETGNRHTIGLAVDSFDRPHIAYVVNGKWKYAYYDGAAWNVETVGLPTNALRADIVIAPDNNPYLVYQTGTDIYFAYRYNGQWILDWFAPGYMSMSNLRVDSTGALHMAMINATDYALTYVKATPTVMTDSDADGVPDSQELPASIDLDADGTADSAQANIKTTMTFDNTKAMGVSYDPAVLDGVVTLQAVDPSTITDTVNRPAELPFGLITFTLDLKNPGDEVTFTVHLSDQVDAGSTWYKYSVAGGWQDYSAYSVLSADRRSFVITAKDGAHGDADGIENGVIVDPGGVSGSVVPDTGIPLTSPGGSSGGGGGGGGGCFLSALP
jgi:hypothetical protein